MIKVWYNIINNDKLGEGVGMMNDNIKQEDRRMEITSHYRGYYIVKAERQDWETLRDMIEKLDAEDMHILLFYRIPLVHNGVEHTFETFYSTEETDLTSFYLSAKLCSSNDLVDIYILEETFLLLDSLIYPEDDDDPYPATAEEINVINKLVEAWARRPVETKN